MGRIGRPHGLRGGVLVEPATDDPRRRFAPGSRLITSDGATLEVARYEAGDRAHIVTFSGVDDRDGAEALRGTELFIPADDRRRLGEGEYWPDELVGMRAESPQGDPMGMVVDVEAGVGQDRLVLDTPTGRVAVPFVEELVPTVDRESGKVIVALPAGLSD